MIDLKDALVLIGLLTLELFVIVAAVQLWNFMWAHQ